MEMELDFGQSFEARQSMRVSPRLVAANYVLELSSQALQQAISRELEQNPALELLESSNCLVCGTELQGSICPRCIQRQKPDQYASDDFDSQWREPSQRDPVSSRDDEFDPLTQVASEETLADRLLYELAVVLDPQDLPIAEFLVYSLDDKGYLSLSLEDVAIELEVDRERVRRVLKLLQSLEPVGVGARDLRECLLIQIDQLEQLGLHQPHVRDLVSTYLTELGERKFNRIARETQLSLEEISAAHDFVKQKLNPHPAHGFSATNARDRDTRALYILPDVVINRGVDGFDVEVIESRRHMLRVDPMYTRLNSELHGARRTAASGYSADDKRHVQQYVNRAKLFIANINQRRQTLLTITRCLVAQQQAYLENGVRHLRPLSRAAVAAELGVHESTVSRATAGKYVMLPNGEVIPFSHFFTPSLSIKDVIKEIVERENAPLTDSQIGERLRKQGITIARRTVAKYRTQLDILPSSLR
jgi:RNA polymerase sigma-54 factor